DRGKTWSEPVQVERGVEWSAIERKESLPPGMVQAMVGNSGAVALAWEWSPGYDRLPHGVWIATSADGGTTFSAPRQIAETWGLISSTSHDGAYYVLYRRGTQMSQQLVAAISRDGGATWASSVVSRN